MVIPVIFYNLSRYDGPLLNLLAQADPAKMSALKPVIHFYQFSGKALRSFIDSFSFIPSLLSYERKRFMKYFFREEEEFQLVKDKQFFPYDYLDCEERLSNTILPSHSEWQSKFSDAISSLISMTMRRLCGID